MLKKYSPSLIFGLGIILLFIGSIIITALWWQNDNLTAIKIFKLYWGYYFFILSGFLIMVAGLCLKEYWS